MFLWSLAINSFTFLRLNRWPRVPRGEGAAGGDAVDGSLLHHAVPGPRHVPGGRPRRCGALWAITLGFVFPWWLLRRGGGANRAAVSSAALSFPVPRASRDGQDGDHQGPGAYVREVRRRVQLLRPAGFPGHGEDLQGPGTVWCLGLL